MFNVVFAVAFMAVSLVAALQIAMQHQKPKSFIYAVGLGSMLAQIVILFAVLHISGWPVAGATTMASAGHSAGWLSL